MTSILFLDDMQERHDKLARGFIIYGLGVDLYSVYTAQTAIDKLIRDGLSFDIVSLDHDLAAEHYNRACTDTTADCGCVVVDAVCLAKERFKNTKFFIHSWNEAAAVRMAKALETCGLWVQRKPFK